MTRNAQLFILVIALAAGSAFGQHTSNHSAKPAVSPYAPYQALIGEWDVTREGSPAELVMRFTYGPNESYIWCATSMIENGKEVPHFEGMAIWNAVHKNLDILFALGLDGSGAQEQGTLYIERDGMFVRDHQLVAESGMHHFRQTFKVESQNRIITSVLRETKNGWAPTFPGSERLIMIRRSTKHQH